jgi:hypothetical protein
MQWGDPRAAFVVSENEKIAALRMDGSVIWSGNRVFASVARANGKWDERGAVQEFSDTGNHGEKME